LIGQQNMMSEEKVLQSFRTVIQNSENTSSFIDVVSEIEKNSETFGIETVEDFEDEEKDFGELQNFNEMLKSPLTTKVGGFYFCPFLKIKKSVSIQRK
jgi:hypothetical protein